MRFALLGDHPDGLDLAGALVDSGRHQLAACTQPLPEAVRQRLGGPAWVPDTEEVLADPAVEAVIVAGPPSVRPEQLRRALQSERHVLCVHPADQKADTAYEAALLQGDVGLVLFAVLPEALHPAIGRLREFVARGDASSPVGEFRLLAVERTSTGEVLDNTQEELAPAVPGWDVLRKLAGEVSEVSSFCDAQELTAGRPVLLAGRFEKGGLFQMTLVPRQPASSWRLAVVGTAGRAEITFPQGWNGPAFLEWCDQSGQRREEYWERWDPWPALVAQLEAAVAGQPATPTWQDEVRALELDDAARRSVERRRVNLMEYQEASEEVGFKGTMTLLGCGVLWAVLLLLIASIWLPRLRWLILPLLLLFAVLQLLRWVIPARPGPEAAEEAPARVPAQSITAQPPGSAPIRQDRPS
jgi:predicted dehydrogenase